MAKLTQREMEICKAIGAKWVSRDGKNCYTSDSVDAWTERPEAQIRGSFWTRSGVCTRLACFDGSLFPSVQNGECIYCGSGELLTDDEINICKALGAKWVTKEVEGEVKLWKDAQEVSLLRVCIATVDAEKFPTLDMGDCIEVP